MMTQVLSAPASVQLRARAAALLDLLGRFPMSALLLMARLAIAAVFWRSAMTKISSWEFTVFLFRDEYRVLLLPPEVAAYVATSFELVCPVLLFFGLATRLATLPLIGMAVVIQLFVYPASWPEHLMWLSLLALILTRGPGVISIDHLIGRTVLGRQG